MKKKKWIFIGVVSVVVVAAIVLTIMLLSKGDENKDDSNEENLIGSITSWDGLGVKSIGKNTAKAELTGSDIRVVYDKDRASSLLNVGGGSYMLLPEKLFEQAGNKVTVSLDVFIDSESSENANIFQFNPCGFGTGDGVWKDAPEISVKANLLTTFFIGGRTINGEFNGSATYNNGVGGDDKAYSEPNGYKTRYAGTASEGLENNQWYNVTLQFSQDEYALYVNGKQVELSDSIEGSDIGSSLEYLFKEEIIQTYIVNSIGNSVYSTEDVFIGKIDNLGIYFDTVSPEDIKENKEKDAEFFWDFSYDTLEIGSEKYVSDLTKYLGETVLTDEDVKMESPDSQTKVLLKKDGDNHYYIAVTDNDTVLVEPSILGLMVEEMDLSAGIILKNDEIETREINEKFSVMTGSQSESVNHCNEITLPFEKDGGSFKVIVRVYNDGFAYRYKDVTVDGKDKLVVTKEVSEIILSENARTWSHNINGTYEAEYIERSFKQLNTTSALLSTPILAQLDDYYMLITEASVYNNNGEYCSSGLETKSGSKQLVWTFGLARDPKKESTGELDSPGHIRIETVETINGFSTPWRAIIASTDINEFCTSDMVAALNDAPDETVYEDTSYIKPGKVAWSWWAEDSSQGSYDKHIEYIDFAAENQWPYVCLDVGWREFEDRLDEMCQYAAKKGVGLFVWINYRDMKDLDTMDTLFKKWSEAGALGLKTDYFESDEAHVLYNMQNVALTAAKYKMMVLYHGCVRPAGEYRTYPNVLTMEAVQGEEWHKWNPYPTVKNCLMYTFTRNILGSMDYTPVGTSVVVNGETYGFGIAKTVVYQSALQHLANAASNYNKYNGLSLLNHIPTTWDTTKVLEGAAGEYVTMIRTKGDEYYIGAMTLEERSISVKLDFIGEGEYTAYVYGDNEDGTRLEITTSKVKKGDTLTYDLLKNGGIAVIITKEEINLDCYEEPIEYSDDYTIYEAEAAGNTLTGTAKTASAMLCSGSAKVGYIGNGTNNRLTINKVTVPSDGEYQVILKYCSGEDRKYTIIVNGSDNYEITGLNSGSFDKAEEETIKLKLKAGENTIEFSNDTYYAPDLDFIAVRNN